MLVLLFNINVLLSDLREPCSEHTNDEDFAVYDFCNKISNEGNILDVLVICEDIPSQEIFKAFNPIDLSSEQIEFPLLNKHTNELVNVLLVCFSKAYRRLLILSISNYEKKKKIFIQIIIFYS
jgi:hypothetical protein